MLASVMIFIITEEGPDAAISLLSASPQLSELVGAENSGQLASLVVTAVQSAGAGSGNSFFLKRAADEEGAAATVGPFILAEHLSGLRTEVRNLKLWVLDAASTPSEEGTTPSAADEGAVDAAGAKTADAAEEQTAADAPALASKESSTGLVLNATSSAVNLHDIESQNTSKQADQTLLTAVPITLEFQNIKFSAVDMFSPDKRRKMILKGVHGVARPGRFLALMGASGAGKTTMLNLLAQRTLPDEGSSILFNGEKLSKELRRKIGYVMQRDIFFANLTVRETLLFTALLRLPYSMTRKEKESRVDQVIDQLLLTKAKNTVVGNPMSFGAGISGGEMKRLNVCNELLTNPAVIALDEPTSGLDSSTALLLCTILRDIARRFNKTVIASIHQPSSQLFQLFDDLLLLDNGEAVYFGPAKSATKHFHSVGYPVMDDFSAGDYLIEMATRPSHRQDMELRSKTVSRAYERSEFRPTEAAVPGTGVRSPSDLALSLPARRSPSSSSLHLAEASTPRWLVPFYYQMFVLTWRAFIQKRGIVLKWITLAQVLLISLIVGLLWFQIGTSESSVSARLGAVFFVCNFNMFFPMFGSLTTFPSERAVLFKERASGSYRLSAYFLSKLAAELPFDLMYPFIFVTITFWMIGLSTSFGTYCLFMLVVWLDAQVAQSLGVMVSCLVYDFEKAIVSASVYSLFSLLSAGFLVKSSSMPIWISWIRFISIIKYAYSAAAVVIYNGISVQCDGSHAVTQSSPCPASGAVSGSATLTAFDIDPAIGDSIGPLFALFIGFRFISYLALRYRGKQRPT